MTTLCSVGDETVSTGMPWRLVRVEGLAYLVNPSRKNSKANDNVAYAIAA
jgi:hypothetical protein